MGNDLYDAHHGIIATGSDHQKALIYDTPAVIECGDQTYLMHYSLVQGLPPGFV